MLRNSLLLRFATLALIAATPATSLAMGPNLLKNSGFESPISNTAWGNWQNRGDLSSVRLISGSGTYLRTKDTSVNMMACVGQLVSVSGGKKYHLLVKNRRVSGAGVQRLAVSFLSSSYGELKHASTGAGTHSSWGWTTLNVTAPPAARYAWVFLGDCTRSIAPATFDWDGAEMHAF
jgi:hypothetical protein